MFEDGARIDDILNVFRRPTLDDKEDKKDRRLSDTVIRYDSTKSFGEDNIRFDFTRNSEVLK